MKFPGARSIRQKLNFILIATAMLALALAGLALVVFDLRSQLGAIEADMVTQADIMGLVSGPAMAFDDPKAGTENLRVLRAKPTVRAAALFDAKGRLFASFKAAASENIDMPVRAAPAPVSADREWVRVWQPVLSDGQPIGTVFLQARHDLVPRALDYLGVLALILGSSLAAALLLSNRLQRMLTDPILAISAVARRIRQSSNFNLRAVRISDDEIGDLADVFNAMLDELGLRAQTLERANQALRASDERYQLAVRGSSAGLWDWDMDEGTVFYSPRFKALLGYSDEEFPDLRASLSNVMHEQDRPAVRQALSDHLSQDKPYQTECRLHLKSGEWRWFFITGMAQKDAGGRAFRMAGSVIDVTERKRAEQILHDANRAKDEFIATLAHELRNPLAPIRTGLEILKKDAANGPASRRARETMERQLAHLIRLIDDLLDISRINSGKIAVMKQRASLADIVESAVEISRPLIDARGHALAVELPACGIELIADATRLAQALGNLLNNAAKYTPPHGRLALKAWQEGDTAVVEVSDNGVGLAPEMLEEVFSLFTQVHRTLDRSQGGLGIGLYLVRNLVALQGGTVTAASGGPGLGCTFTVRLPCLLRTDADTAVAIEPSAAPGAAPSLKVLVVDDNVDAAETLAAVLEMIGCRTRNVHDGSEVLDCARDFEPDIVLLDIGLPTLSGYEVARQLRADSRLGRIVLIAVTGWGTEEDRRRSRDAGFDEHLTKPVDLAVVERLFSRFAARIDAPSG